MIPLLDLQAQYQGIKLEIKQAIDEVLESQHFIMGDAVKNFESEINNYISANNSLGCASGSDALLLSLMAIDIQPGEYVITTPFTFFATAGAISRLGAIPIFIDIEPDSFNIDPKKIRAFLEGTDALSQKIKAPLNKIKAIIPVHLYGQMANMDEIMDIAAEYNLFVIEDAAQSIGSKYKGKNAGTIGDFGCFSFFPSKNLGAYGDAGLITVKDDELAEKTNILRLHGSKPKYYHKVVGVNSRLDALQAAILSVKLNYLESWSEARRATAFKYNRLFEEAGLTTNVKDCDTCKTTSECELSDNKLVLPQESTGSESNNGRHIYHQYTIRVQHRDQLSEHLNKHKIGNAVYYPVPLHMQECFSDLEYVPEDCGKAFCASKQALSLPIYPELEDTQIEEVVSCIADFLK